MTDFKYLFLLIFPTDIQISGHRADYAGRRANFDALRGHYGGPDIEAIRGDY